MPFSQPLPPSMTMISPQFKQAPGSSLPQRVLSPPASIYPQQRPPFGNFSSYPELKFEDSAVVTSPVGGTRADPLLVTCVISSCMSLNKPSLPDGWHEACVLKRASGQIRATLFPQMQHAPPEKSLDCEFRCRCPAAGSRGFLMLGSR